MQNNRRSCRLGDCSSYTRTSSYGRCDTSCSPPVCQSPPLCRDPCQVDILQKQVQCQRQQIHSQEGKIMSLKNDLDQSRMKNSQCCNELESMRRNVCQRDEALARQECCVNELKNEIKNKENQIRCLQDKLCASENCNSQKEACLTDCKTEMSQLTCQLEDIKAKMNCEIKKRDTCICQMKEDLRRICEELKEKKCHNAKLDQNLLEVKNCYHQAASSLKECDARVKCLNDKIAQLECQSKQDCLQYKRDLQEANNCACQASQEAKCLSDEVNRLKCALQDKINEIEACCTDKDALCRELSCEKEKVNSLREQLQHKVCELTELQRQHDSCKCEVERQCRENECCRQRLQEKQNEVTMLCDEKKCLEDDLANLQCRYDRDICHLEKAVDQMARESSCLRNKLEDREGKLCAVKDRIANTDCEIRRICSIDCTAKACASDYCNSNVAGSPSERGKTS